jgi:CSLREA domain-containing protein
MGFIVLLGMKSTSAAFVLDPTAQDNLQEEGRFSIVNALELASNTVVQEAEKVEESLVEPNVPEYGISLDPVVEGERSQSSSFETLGEEDILSNLPLTFEKNSGQIEDEELRYFARKDTSQVRFYDDQIEVELVSPEGQAEIGFKFKDTDSDSTSLMAEDRSVTKTNYFIGDDTSKHISNNPTFDKVTYQDLYKGVSATYYTSAQDLKYDITIQPHTTDPNKVDIQVSGAKEIYINEDGNLTIETDAGTIYDQSLNVYQMIDGQKRYIPASFKVTSQNSYGFDVGVYNLDYPLVIDPLVYSTYFGGTGFDSVSDIVSSDSGSIYITGSTNDTLSIPAPGGGATTFPPGGSNDIFISKLDSTLGVVDYTTFIGGSANDYVSVLKVDANENVYIAGSTQSNDYPMQSANDSTFLGFNEAYISKLDNTGSILDYSTYLGGDGEDDIYDIEIDGSENIYLTGVTTSTDLNNLNGLVADGEFNGTKDIFVAKANESNSYNYDFLTYLSGGALTTATIENRAYLELDSLGDIYVAGLTSTDGIPTTPGAFDTSYSGGDEVFITKLNSTATSRIYSAYIGGGDDDLVFDLALTPNNELAVVGSTYSDGGIGEVFPTTAGVFDSSAVSKEGFIEIISSAGDSYISSFVGGPAAWEEQVSSVDIDSEGGVYLVGRLGAASGWSTPSGVFQKDFGGGFADAYLLKLKSDLSNIEYFTYIGGANYEYGNALTLDSAKTPDNVLVLGGLSSAIPGIGTGGVQSSPAGSEDAFIAQLNTIPTFLVNSNADTIDANIGDGVCDVDLGTTGWQCTLRAAIQESNSSTFLEHIDFDNTYDIEVDSDLPSITDGVIIDGKSSPTYLDTPDIDNPVITISPSAILGDGNGNGLYILVGGSDSIIQGLGISDFDRGIYAYESYRNIIRENDISNNTYAGIDVYKNSATLESNLIHNNDIGIKAYSADGDINSNIINDNSRNGIAYTAHYAIFNQNAASITISGNEIYNNGENGIDVNGRDVLTISQNSIYNNTELGIDLSGYAEEIWFPFHAINAYDFSGSSWNDVDDTDDGPNHMQNFPYIIDVSFDGVDTTATGYLIAAEDDTYTLEFFSDTNPAGETLGEGEIYLGTAAPLIFAPGEFQKDFSFTVPGDYSNDYLTSTATNSSGATSEFGGNYNSRYTEWTSGVTDIYTIEADDSVTLNTVLDSDYEYAFIFINQDDNKHYYVDNTSYALVECLNIDCSDADRFNPGNVNQIITGLSSLYSSNPSYFLQTYQYSDFSKHPKYLTAPNLITPDYLRFTNSSFATNTTLSTVNFGDNLYLELSKPELKGTSPLDTISLTLSTSSGDSETLNLTEIADTGVFQGTISSQGYLAPDTFNAGNGIVEGQDADNISAEILSVKAGTVSIDQFEYVELGDTKANLYLNKANEISREVIEEAGDRNMVLKTIYSEQGIDQNGSSSILTKNFPAPVDFGTSAPSIDIKVNTTRSDLDNLTLFLSDDLGNSVSYTYPGPIVEGAYFTLNPEQADYLGPFDWSQVTSIGIQNDFTPTDFLPQIDLIFDNLVYLGDISLNMSKSVTGAYTAPVVISGGSVGLPVSSDTGDDSTENETEVDETVDRSDQVDEIDQTDEIDCQANPDNEACQLPPEEFQCSDGRIVEDEILCLDPLSDEVLTEEAIAKFKKENPLPATPPQECEGEDCDDMSNPVEQLITPPKQEEKENPTLPTEDKSGETEYYTLPADTAPLGGGSLKGDIFQLKVEKTDRNSDPDKNGCSTYIDNWYQLDKIAPDTPEGISTCDWHEIYKAKNLEAEGLTVNGGIFPTPELLITGGVYKAHRGVASSQVNLSLIDSDNFSINLGTAITGANGVYNLYSSKELKAGEYTLVATTKTSDGKDATAMDTITIDPDVKLNVDLKNFSGITFENNKPVKHKIDSILNVGSKNFAYGTTSLNTKVTGYFNSMVLTSVVMSDSSKGTFYIEPRADLDPDEIHTFYLLASSTENPDIKSTPIIVKFKVNKTYSLWMFILAIIILLIIIYMVYRKLRKQPVPQKAHPIIEPKQSRINPMGTPSYSGGLIVSLLVGLFIAMVPLNTSNAFAQDSAKFSILSTIDQATEQINEKLDVVERTLPEEIPVEVDSAVPEETPAKVESEHLGISLIPEVQSAETEENNNSVDQNILNNLPVTFEKNSGQLDDEEVRFFTRKDQSQVYFYDDEVKIQLNNQEGQAEIGLQFKDTEESTLMAENRSLTKTNYFIGNDSSEYITNNPTFDQVTYDNLYHGVSATYYTSAQDLKYDINVQPYTTDPNKIEMQVSGAKNIYLNEEGNLTIETEAGDIYDQNLSVYQVIDGQTHYVSASFKVTSSSSYGFVIGEYNPDHVLTIDPLVYSTYLGGNGSDTATDIKVDSEENVYVLGTTNNVTNFPVPGGGSTNLNGGGTDVFLSKIDSTLGAVAYTTFIGGSGNETASSLALDASNNAYIVGSTDSLDYPVTDLSLNSGLSDGYITKLNSTGNTNIFSTYFGGSDLDTINDLDLDSTDNIYITGDSRSIDLVGTTGDTSQNGVDDTFAAKYLANGTLDYLTFLTGDLGAEASSAAIKVDSFGEAHIVGNITNNALAFPNTSGALPLGGIEAFAVKLSADGSFNVYSTFLSSIANDFATDAALNLAEELVLVGGGNLTPSINAFDTTQLNEEAYVAILSADGNTVQALSYIGGDADDRASGVVVDSQDSIYITGLTDSDAGWVTFTGSKQNPTVSNLNSFIVKLNADLSELEYNDFYSVGSTLYVDSDLKFFDLSLDANKTANNVWTSGFTDTLALAPDPNALQDTMHGTQDAFLTVFKTVPTLVVNFALDLPDSNIGDGVCEIAAGTNICTLRAAIQEANADNNLTGIQFDIPGVATPAAPHILNLDWALPQITSPVIIDGQSEPDFVSSPVIQLDCTNIAWGTYGLYLNTDDSEIKGFSMIKGKEADLRVDGDNNLIQGNYVGLRADGIEDGFQSGISGITVNGDNNLIGGNTNLNRNVITAHSADLRVDGDNNLIQGNYLGTKADGTMSINSASNTLIIYGANNLVGGTDSSEANLIGGFWSEGLYINGGSGNLVQGNYIGENTLGDAISDPNNGLLTAVTLEDSLDTILEDNTILNADRGVYISGLSTGNKLSRNIIRSVSGGLGIVLSGSGANDDDDVDAGVNEFQNYPQLTDITINPGDVDIEGVLNSAPNTQYDIEFFYDTTVINSEEFGQGEFYIGSTTVTTDAQGEVDYSLNFPVVVPVGAHFSATATDPNGNTSQFGSEPNSRYNVDSSILDPGYTLRDNTSFILEAPGLSTNQEYTAIVQILPSPDYITGGGVLNTYIDASTFDGTSYQLSACVDNLNCEGASRFSAIEMESLQIRGLNNVFVDDPSYYIQLLGYTKILDKNVSKYPDTTSVVNQVRPNYLRFTNSAYDINTTLSEVDLGEVLYVEARALDLANDGNLGANLDVDITSSSLDSETFVLTEDADTGIFQGFINSAGDGVNVGNGILEGADSDDVDLSYVGLVDSFTVIDDMESYADLAAFNASWNITSTGAETLSLEDFGGSQNQAIKTDWTGVGLKGDFISFEKNIPVSDFTGKNVYIDVYMEDKESIDYLDMKLVSGGFETEYATIWNSFSLTGDAENDNFVTIEFERPDFVAPGKGGPGPPIDWTTITSVGVNAAISFGNSNVFAFDNVRYGSQANLSLAGQATAAYTPPPASSGGGTGVPVGPSPTPETQTCPDGSVIPASSTCPVETPSCEDDNSCETDEPPAEDQPIEETTYCSDGVTPVSDTTSCPVYCNTLGWVGSDTYCPPVETPSCEDDNSCVVPAEVCEGPECEDQGETCQGLECDIPEEDSETVDEECVGSDCDYTPPPPGGEEEIGKYSIPTEGGEGQGSISKILDQDSIPKTDRNTDDNKNGCSNYIDEWYEIDKNAPILNGITDCDWYEIFDQEDLSGKGLSVNGGTFPTSDLLITGGVYKSNTGVAASKVHLSLIDSDNYTIDLGTAISSSNGVYNYLSKTELKKGDYKLIATTTFVDGETKTASDHVTIDPDIGLMVDLENFSGIAFQDNHPIRYKLGSILRVGNKQFAYGTTSIDTKVKGYFNSVVLSSVVMSDSTKGSFYMEPREKLYPDEVHTFYLMAESTENPDIKSAPIEVKFKIKQGISLWVILLLFLFLVILYLMYRKYQNGIHKNQLKKEEPSLGMRTESKIGPNKIVPPLQIL